jgi:hypothetical protein
MMKKTHSLLVRLSLAAAIACTAGIAAAKLPVPPETPESKAKAEEASAKAAAASKKASEDLARYMDKAVANWQQGQGNAGQGNASAQGNAVQGAEGQAAK